MILTRKQRQIEEKYGRPIADVLTEAYNTHGTDGATASALGLTRNTFRLWMASFGVKVRKIASRPRMYARATDTVSKSEKTSVG